ncbi:MAG: hypothetical protein B7O98_00070 [Zestosphaera tikiterensis]|uniref:MCM C-terminal domain-containing protein n=1 Tax=Zestosphaera tikiterensis TaxID=1973259 RepID=A0A2R7Y8K4_9CREN|nr:MAG: hypothetical protein B7O98_00070 [Zestosphaera tikiterensis]
MIVVKGLRRTGKSSLLRVGLSECGFPYLLIDSRALGSFSPDRAYDLMASSLSKLVERHRSLLEFLRKVREVYISGGVAAVSVGFLSRERRALVEVLERLNEWGESRGSFVVLALDEAQEFRFYPRFTSILAYVYDHLRWVKVVMAGSEVGVLDKFLGREEPKAPLYGRPYVEIEMRRLSREKALEFLKLGFEEAGVKPENVEEAVNVFDGVIGWLTSYGYYALRVGHKEALKRVLDEAVSLVKDEVESFLALRKQARDRYLTILQLISTPMRWSDVKRGVTAKLGVKVSDKQLSNYLAELVNYGLAVNQGGKYVIADPIIAEAVSRMR